MKRPILLKKLYTDEKEFVTSSELKAYCKPLGLKYDDMVKYFEERGYLVRIFRGIFYVKSFKEVKLGRSRYNHLKLVSKGLELKGVDKWYFGLHTALKINNMTHEHFAVEDVISDSVFRSKPVTIAGYRFNFVKLSPALLTFGIKKKDGLRYADPEKTVLDFIYIWRYNGIPDEKIVHDISEWTSNVSKEKLKKYAKKYPKAVAKIIEGIS